MAKKTAFITGVGTARYPSLHVKDTFGDYPSNKYKTDWIPDSPADMALLKKQVAEWMKTEKFKLKNPKMPFKEKDGVAYITAKSGFQPAVFNNKNLPLNKWDEDLKGFTAPPAIGGGSKIRLAVVPFNYGDGVAFLLQGVRVLDLKEQAGGSMFGEPEDDGFGASEESSDTSEETFDADELDI